MSNANINMDQVREAAYYIWQSEGCPNGMDVEHWNKALQQTTACCTTTTTKKTTKAKTTARKTTTKKTVAKKTAAKKK